MLYANSSGVGWGWALLTELLAAMLAGAATCCGPMAMSMLYANSSGDTGDWLLELLATVLTRDVA
jgi:hypothetical protein